MDSKIKKNSNITRPHPPGGIPGSPGKAQGHATQGEVIPNVTHTNGLQSEFKNETEASWNDSGDDILFKLWGKKTARHWYEPVTFKVGKVSYIPDFMHVFTDGTLAFIEVKASRFSKWRPTSIAKAKTMAAVYSMFEFWEAIPEKGEWGVKRISG